MATLSIPKNSKTENSVFPRVFEFFRKLENLKTVKIEISETFEKFNNYNILISYNTTVI
jgi:hypothetical protein